MLEVQFYDSVPEELLRFAVVISKAEGKWVFCKHRERTTWEVPGGRREPEEAILETARRELREETGAVPGIYESLGRIIPAPGCYSEVLHLYLARDLKMETQDLDPDEFLNVERIPFDEMVRRCMDGEVEDAKTVAAVLKAKILLGL